MKYLAAKVEVKERGIKTLTKDIISGTDEDTDDEMLTFLVVNNPNYGIIEKQGMLRQMGLIRHITSHTSPA